jgi:hypothetical protein
LQPIHSVKRSNGALSAAVHGATPKTPQAVAFAIIETGFAQRQPRHFQPFDRPIVGLKNSWAMAKHQQQATVVAQGHGSGVLGQLPLVDQLALAIGTKQMGIIHIKPPQTLADGAPQRPFTQAVAAIDPTSQVHP